VTLCVIQYIRTGAGLRTAKVRASRTRHHILWVGLWVGFPAVQYSGKAHRDELLFATVVGFALAPKPCKGASHFHWTPSQRSILVANWGPSSITNCSMPITDRSPGPPSAHESNDSINQW
jgi:hypothetical protein